MILVATILTILACLFFTIVKPVLDYHYDEEGEWYYVRLKVDSKFKYVWFGSSDWFFDSGKKITWARYLRNRKKSATLFSENLN